MSVAVEISFGDLIDKITILEIKACAARDAREAGHVHDRRRRRQRRAQRQSDGLVLGGIVLAIAPAEFEERGIGEVIRLRQQTGRHEFWARDDDCSMPAIADDMDDVIARRSVG